MENTLSQTMPNLNTHLKFGNFDPTNLNIEETVNVTMLIDSSGSMSSYAQELNEDIEKNINEISGWSQAPKIYLSIGTFDSKIEVLNGFQQINNVTPPVFDPRGSSTRLYDASLEFLKNTLAQQEKSLQSGILTKSIFFVLTDGEDNASKGSSAGEVKALMEHINKTESMKGTFQAFLFGLGDKSTFESAANEMGLALYNGDLKKAFAILSASVKSYSTKKGPVII